MILHACPKRIEGPGFFFDIITNAAQSSQIFQMTARLLIRPGYNLPITKPTLFSKLIEWLSERSPSLSAETVRMLS